MARLREPDPLPVVAKQCKEHIEEDSARRPPTQCGKCHGRQFQRHQQRGRWFLLVVACVVCPILCLLVRWRCANCGATLTHLPSSCVPFKRYLREEIETRAERYVETEPMSYREVVKERGAAVVYDDPIAEAEATEAEKEAEDVREMAPSTAYRWIGSIAAHREQWQPAVRLAGQAQPEARLSSIRIAAAKYCSAARRRVLERCGLVLRALKIVTGRNPTQLATLGSSP